MSAVPHALRPSVARATPLLLALAASCSAPGGVASIEPVRPLRADTLEHNGWDRDADLLHVHIDVDFDVAASSVAGDVTSTLRGLRENTQELQLHARGLSIEAVHDGEGRALEFGLDEPMLVVQLAEPLEFGDEVSLTVTYSASPERGLYFRGTSKDADGPAPQFWTQGQAEDHRYWLPIWDFPNDRATVSADLRAPGDLITLSNGLLQGVVEHEDGDRTHRWRLEQRIPTYLIAVAGGAWELYTDDWNGLPVEYWVGPGSGEEKARRAFGETPAMLDWFSELLGVPYPYPKYAQVAVAEFVAGGMENASLSIQNDYVICTADVDAELDGETRLLVAHELAHQWFGDLVTCFGWSHLWLNEAWASYLEVLWEGQVLGEDVLALRLERYRNQYLRRGESTRRPLSEDWRTQVTEARCSHEYVKGPWVLAMLEREVGSAAFWRGVTLYLERHSDDLVQTEDFTRAMFDATGRNVEGFLEQWVEAGGHPQYEVRLRERDGESGPELVVRVRQTQRTSELVPLFDVNVEVELHDERGITRESLRIDDAEEEFLLPLVGTLRDFVFDAPCAVLCATDLQKPLGMWARQAREGTPAQRWRALDALEVEARRGVVAALDVYREVGRNDAEPFLRRRAYGAFDHGPHAPFLMERIQREPDALARLELLERLARRRLSKESVAAIELQFDGVDTKRVRAALDRLRVTSQPRDGSGS